MVFGDDAFPSSVVSNGIWKRSMNSFTALLRRFGSHRSRPAHHRFALGESVSQHHRDVVDPCRIRRHSLNRALDLPMIGHIVPRQVEFAGHRNVHRPRAPRECGIHRLLQDVAGLIGVIDDPAALGASREHLLRNRAYYSAQKSR